MNTAYFDIETNAIEDFATLSDLKQIHCIVVAHEDQVYVGTDNPSIERCIEILESCDAIVGHNAVSFDVPALCKLYDFKYPQIIDTVLMGRCMFPDVRSIDFRKDGFDKELIGSHSLKAWGKRIGILKGEFGETTDWSQCTPEMIEYCKQDVRVTRALYIWLMAKKPSMQMLELEHYFAVLMRRQELNGFPFDSKSADKLTEKLMVRRAELKDELSKTFPATVVDMKSTYFTNRNGDEFPSKKAMLETGYKQSDIFVGRNKTKTIPFNPNSRDQICERLMEMGWKPNQYEGKRPAINEGVLKSIGTDEALQLCEYLLLTKRLGQVAEGNQAWTKLARKGRIHGGVNTNGAVSGRCTHMNPNVAQVPAVRATFGKECRECFTAPQGKVLVGADASGLELRCLAHYLHPWDKGAYAKTILEGDIHTENQKAAGLDTRDQAKTFIYAFLYGAGDEKIGKIVNGTRADGKRLKNSFKEKIPAVAKLLKAVESKVKQTNFLKGLDGRQLPCRSPHSALNLLLQSAGAVIMKQSLICFANIAEELDLPYELHANVHDEVQFSCDSEHSEQLGQAFVDAIVQAGEELNFKCKLDGEYKVGNNWAETH